MVLIAGSAQGTVECHLTITNNIQQMANGGKYTLYRISFCFSVSGDTILGILQHSRAGQIGSCIDDTVFKATIFSWAKEFTPSARRLTFNRKD